MAARKHTSCQSKLQQMNMVAKLMISLIPVHLVHICVMQVHTTAVQVVQNKLAVPIFT